MFKLEENKENLRLSSSSKVHSYFKEGVSMVRGRQETETNNRDDRLFHSGKKVVECNVHAVCLNCGYGKQGKWKPLSPKTLCPMCGSLKRENVQS